MDITPLNFINALRKSEVHIESIYMLGGCYQFSLVLKKMYRGDTLINDGNDHVITSIKNIYYDITGVVNNEESYHAMSAEEKVTAESWSFGAAGILSIGECPFCEEPLLSSAPAVDLRKMRQKGTNEVS